MKRDNDNAADQYGFRWGQLDVVRLAEFKGTRALSIRSDFGSIEVYVSPTGRSIRVWRDGDELKLMKASSKKSELLSLPEREWNAPQAWWSALLIVPTRQKHDSGYSIIAIIGVDKDHEAREIIARCDDIHWPAQSGISKSMPDYSALNTDCYWPSGVLRLWSREYEFSVKWPTSSTDILIRRVEKTP